MKLYFEDFSFDLMTPAMIGGAEVTPVALLFRNDRAGPRSPDQASGSKPEMRVASIRGHVRWWHRFAGLQPPFHAVWGQTEPTASASRVALSVVPRLEFDHKPTRMLPHAGLDCTTSPPSWAKAESHRRGIAASEKFTIRVTRLVGCGEREWKAAVNAVKIWLLLGGIGVRSSRAAGSVWPNGDWVPRDCVGLKAALAELGFRNAVAMPDLGLLDDQRVAHERNEALRCRLAASDTVSGSPEYFGSIKPRRPSPLKMKVALLGDRPVLLITGLDSEEMAAARAELKGHPLGDVPWHTI
jgi:hypothetical protein